MRTLRLMRDMRKMSAADGVYKNFIFCRKKDAFSIVSCYDICLSGGLLRSGLAGA